MSFLAPAFLAALAAVAIPVLIHLIQRERKRVVEFPSLMFLRRIPYQSVRRRRVRHWLLLAMRAAAVALLVAAFARPFFRQGALAAGAAAGAREVVIVLDRSASMGYGDHWARAQAAARRAVDALGGDDRATLVLFARSAEENLRATTDRARLKAAVDAARVGAGATEFGPALKLAQSILARSRLARREVLLISDFQKVGWRTGTEDVHFPEGTRFTPVSVASSGLSNVSVASVTFGRAVFSGEERVTVTAGLVNRGAAPAGDLPVTLEIDGQQIQTVRASVGANASASAAFASFTLAQPNVRGVVRAGTDALPADNQFDFVLTPSRPVRVLIVNPAAGGGDDPAFYLAKALGIGSTPSFQIQVRPAVRVTPADLDKADVVVLNNTAPPPAAAGGALERFVERGGGLLVAAGERAAWPSGPSPLWPGTLGPMVDRSSGPAATLGYIDYSHPMFELFKAPHSGDFSAVRILRYRAIDPAPGDRVLARYEDGGVAAVERRAGQGRVIAWSSTLDDSWNDLALKPVYLPLVHETVRYLARYQEPAAWHTVGQAIDVDAASRGTESRTGRVVLTPSGDRVPIDAAGRTGYVELDEQGFYEVRARGVEERRPYTVAADLDPSESDLTPLDPQELVAAVTGHATPTAAAGDAAAPTPEETERRQAIWWYLMLAASLLLIGETLVSNRISARGSVQV